MTDDQGKHGPEIDDATGVETTGHEWDGLKELNNPLPRWWLIIFYATCAWAVVYWVFMPALPGISGHTRGLRDHSERENVAMAVADLKAFRSERANQLLSIENVADVENDPDLLQFAMAAGESAFGDNCATCHGSGGRGYKGYPNLNDDVWLWGGSLDSITTTIKAGIRANHPQTRYSAMPAFGSSGVLTRGEIDDVVEYVVHISGREAEADAVARGAATYEAQCAACHGADGTGDREQGAPNLTDAVWLYGSEREEIRTQIWNARNGVMPSWDARLDDATITALAVYVHTLGGGE